MTEPIDPGALRIGDTERDTAATALGEHFAAGRLDSEEYDERVAQVWAARTRAELPPLFDDLPGGPPEQLRLHPGPPRQPWPATGQATGQATGRATGRATGPPTEHWVASRSQWKQGRQAVVTRASQAPTWLLVVAAIVLVPLVLGFVASALPFLIAGVAVWFFLAGPGKCGSRSHHRWDRSTRW